MKKTKKFKASLLVALVMLLLGATTILGATNEKKLSADKWVTQPAYYNGYTYYKVTVKEDGYLTLSAKKTSAMNSNYMYLDVYEKENKEYMHLSEPIWTTDKSKTAKYAVEKGTYYLRAYPGVKFKYTFTKASKTNKANYCASKAVELKKNKEVAIVNTAMNGYDRWYKIKLTKKQAITYWRNGGSVYIYDSNMKPIDTLSDDEDYTKYYSRSKLKKGTYYIRIVNDAYYYSSYNSARLSTFKWK